MADTPPAELPLAPNGEVKAYDRLGNKVTVPKERVGELYGMGGRVAKKEEVTAQQLEDDYAKRSTLSKVGGLVSPALPAPVQMALRGSGAIALPPELEAYRAGASQTFSGGLEAMVTKEGVDLVAGKEAAHAFGKTQTDLKVVHEGMYSAGEAVGFVAGAIAGGPKGGAAKAIPGVGIGAIGGAVEGYAAKKLAGVAATGAIGRALATGGSLAARGAAEGGLYSAASSVTEDMLGDRDIAADKLFAAVGHGAFYGAAGGAVIGAAGSLAATGGRAVVGAARDGISRALTRGEGAVTGAAARAEAAATEAATVGKQAVEGAVADAKAAVGKSATEAADEAGKAARFAAEQTGTKVEQEMGSLRDTLGKAAQKSEQHGWAQEQAWKALGAGNGLQSTSFAKSAERYLPNGVKDVGEVILRKGIINAEDGVLNAAMHGTPAAMAPKIEAELQIVGKKIGDLTAASPARIDGAAIDAAVQSVTGKYTQSFATKPIGNSVQRYGEGLMEHLGVATRDAEGKLVVNGNVALQDLLRERKAIDSMVFEGVALDPSMTVQLKRELRGKLEGLITDSLDEAGGKLPGTLRAEYKALKHDYTALSIASEAAEDSAARAAKAAMFGLTDTLRGGGSVIKTVGSKLVRERGNAAAAVLLSRMADMGTISRAIKAVDEQIGRASTGLLSAPRKSTLPHSEGGPVRARAERAMQRVADLQANPERLAEHATAAAEPYQASAPKLAGAFSQRLTSAAAFLASKMPAVPEPDPFDPHPRPMLTDAQASEVAAYASYAERPMKFFEEAEHGKLTYEGVETARALMPGAFAELQTRTIEGLAGLIARGKPPPYLAQQRLGMMLGFPAVPEQRPAHMGFLQANVLGSEKAGKASAGAQSTPKRPMPTKTQSSTLDRLEGK